MRQLDLALEIGKSSNYINSIENGKYFPSPETIESIARSLGIEPVRLFVKCEESEKEKIAETVINIEETLRTEVLESIQKAFSKIKDSWFIQEQRLQYYLYRRQKSVFNENGFSIVIFVLDTEIFSCTAQRLSDQVR